MKLAGIAYCPHNELMNFDFKLWAEGFVITKVLYYQLYDITGYVGVLPHDDSIYYVLQGTDSVENAILDTMSILDHFDRFPGYNVYVHRGFEKTIEAIYEDLHHEIKRLLDFYEDEGYGDIVKVKGTGHSLGGALAHLSAVALAQDGIDVELITFGSPKVGNGNFARLSDELVPEHFRVVNYREFASRVPFAFMGYAHAGTEVYFEHDGSYRVCKEKQEDPTCSMQWPWPHQWSIADHMHYFDNISVFSYCTTVVEDQYDYDTHSWYGIVNY